jgi:hypothetical protein
MMSKITFSIFLLLLPLSVFAAGPDSALSRDSMQVNAWFGKTLYELSAQVPGLKFVGSGTATSVGVWHYEVWVIGKAMRKPGVPCQFLVLTHPPATQEQNSSVVSDVLVFESQKGSDLFVHECSSASKQIPVAAIAKIKNGRIGGVIQAWVADTNAGKLVQLEPGSVRCTSEQETAE